MMCHHGYLNYPDMGDTYWIRYDDHIEITSQPLFKLSSALRDLLKAAKYMERGHRILKVKYGDDLDLTISPAKLKEMLGCDSFDDFAKSRDINL